MADEEQPKELPPDDQPIHGAAFKGDSKTINEILAEDKSAASSPGFDGLTPLMYAAWKGHEDCAKILLSNGAEIDALFPGNNWTALHFAAAHGRVELLRLLIDKTANISAQDKDGNTPLHLAAGWGKIDAVIALLERNADPSIVNKEKLTAAELAKKGTKTAPPFPEIARAMENHSGGKNIKSAPK
eukprot:CAMPEP_0201475548 /NCGR_PEP_ID=MMETSP0151_2-20130828/956_1 /ASSEMBLY_ACC=CAM_ASM_000257 /TAXON_ID=200890 /ORGANISM="Paramoeba atlantica, Strain 621/1 / CCAP 1560/9" /LENGTH=185 /DNA_ID=CAMNT_0047855669 /DNA_START=120 /DNA_END=677 /DNA_ORIENTATION=+